MFYQNINECPNCRIEAGVTSILCSPHTVERLSQTNKTLVLPKGKNYRRWERTVWNNIGEIQNDQKPLPASI